MNFDSLLYPYPSRRSVVFANRGMVATSQPLAAQAGLEILKRGGNAIDAAIATATCLAVLEPTANGIGGDAFALVWTAGKLHGLNSSGPAPMKLSLEALANAGHEKIPEYGVSPVTVPGAPACWAELSRRFGRLPLTASMAPAIEYAEHGFPVSPLVANRWQAAFDTYRALLSSRAGGGRRGGGEEFRHWFETFAPLGRAPRAGEIWRLPAQAETLARIAQTNGEAFYRGDLAEKIGEFFERHAGYLSADDLAAFTSEWVEPVGIDYRGYEVWEIPPNGHGIVALMALNILKGFEFAPGDRDTARTRHLQIEALKIAFADGLEYIADLRRMKVRVEDLLSNEYAAQRRELICDKATAPPPGTPRRGGTVYLATADADGNMVSFIQSNYLGFGSGMVVPSTGIALHNRGFCFSSDSAHDNCLEPGKKPYHTIIPGFLTKGGEALGPFGVMGAFMQPQGHVMVVMNTVDFLLNPQAALDAPRFRWQEGRRVDVEREFPEPVAGELLRMGHEIQYAAPDDRDFGRGQIIWRGKEGVLAGGGEPRTDGQVAAW